MSGQSAFEKRYVDPKDQSDVEGLLEHFNLPPKVIAFLRANKRAVQIVLAVIISLIVAVSLYDSYKEKKIENAASNLALALKESGEEQKNALQRVVDNYSGTDSAVWATVELAHLEMKTKNYDAAATMYADIHNSLKADNPLFGLTLFSLAQAEEAKKDYEAALAGFEKLKDLDGYQLTGYTGIARIYETQGELDKALGIYGQYLAVIGDNNNAGNAKAFIEEKIARIKARQ
ncbi:tetratricopeptide repeat protein [Desulfosediminicola flagellatus]|uniref:tetratricopeptide repeat protein n=1 Tax=Desulfosediminicola flagellatus TaxID=2569541 RepID=UPI00142EDCF4|nr:tetratricopeptide repeat protein [Desulfosediminicola flagellatus]